MVMYSWDKSTTKPNEYSAICRGAPVSVKADDTNDQLQSETRDLHSTLTTK